MLIPTRYVGSWHGEVHDTKLKNSYTSEIVVNTDGIGTGYHMARGLQQGVFAAQSESDGFLVLKETVNKWSGTLMLYLDAAGDMKCIWRSGSQFSGEATMTRDVRGT